jgi:hypothetical protein
MTEWLNGLQSVRSHPRLWVEWLSLLESKEPLVAVRTVNLHPGMNIVWAREPDDGDAGSNVESAGHGVGKTSFCLLLRYCLGDEAPSINVLREKAAAGFPKGGVAALVHLDGTAWVVFRPYGQYAQSLAGSVGSVGTSLEALFAGELEGSFQEFLDGLHRVFIETLTATTLPGTNQPLEWRHLLAWCIRDQKTRFDTFFHWRDGDALGFRRPRQDPPVLVQAVLGLLGQEVDALMRQLESAEASLRALEEELTELERYPAFAFATAERRLRTRLEADESTPLFSVTVGASVEQLLADRNLRADQVAEEFEPLVEAANDLLGTELVRLDEAKHADKLCDSEARIARAVLSNNRDEFDRLQAERAELENLAGHCRYGDVAFSDCDHIAARRNSTSLAWHIRRQAAEANVASQTQAAEQLSQRAADARAALQRQATAVRQKQADVRRLELRRWTSENERATLKGLWDEMLLLRRQRDEGTGSAELERARERRTQLSSQVARLRTELETRRLQTSARADDLKALTRRVVGRLLGDTGYGAFHPNADVRPFELDVGGEAYQVLEVLLGDATSLFDAVTAESNRHPGFLVHDCPREADMSERLYREFLLMMAEAAAKFEVDSLAPFQYIVTTTSPPPVQLRDSQHVALELRPGSDENLLFKRRLVPRLPGF